MLSFEPFPTAAGTRRPPYRHLHKALRQALVHMLHRAGTLDAADPQEREQLVAEVERTLAVCADHLAHERRFLLDPLRARAPRAVVAFDDDHAEQLANIDALRLLLLQLRNGGGHDTGLAHELYRRLSQFVGENLLHMAEEESSLTRALWAHFSDDEIAGFLAALHAARSPAEHVMFTRWMAQSLHARELAELLDAWRRQAPREVFRTLSVLVRDELGPARWARVSDHLGLLP